MTKNFKKLMQHDMSDDCPICHAEDLVTTTLIPAVAAWEIANDFPQFSLALHGAAGLLSAMIEEGYKRDEIEVALKKLLDEFEVSIANNTAMAGPPQGSA
ncbi:MAG: hypothetical protein VX780_05985 [Pseudomonadota bacterium]|nr:hypothetical protein [Pseudomonadota bacterium]